ncbi:hypothetical protein [Nocardiopsis sp. NRRL B-16309]|uniref:hypothetical protein n=1 Tax=Nocardiopsis sp. NRRL B-16309 TaxID=1519494 RepID=UPI0006AFBBC7|nr:hypothetical protein [Nocardiopsis sp. NRRL B-16309]KOX10146.1 hypothetical protein ADL05_26080 [Nocardiopsis sp. NRRL B-16309]
MPDAGSVWVDVLPDLKKFGPRLRAELKAHADKGLDVPVGIDTKAARSELSFFKRELDTLGRRHPRIRVTADTKSALSGLVAVDKAADRLDGRTINMKVATSGSGPVAPATPRAPTSGGSGSGGGQRPFTDVSPAGVAALTTLIPPLIPAVGALAGGLGAVASGFIVAAAGAGAFALAAVPAIKDATEATGDLSAQQEMFRDSLGGLTASWNQFRSATDGPVLVAAARGVDVANVGLSKLIPVTHRTATALGTLGVEARNGLDGERWSNFFSFLDRQATPTTLTFGRTLGNLATGVAGFAVSMEPLWNEVAPGLEDMSARFAAWGNDSAGFTDFIEWTIENGPVFLGFFGQIAETAIDVGVALGPLGTVYAQGLTILAGAISAVAETAPWLLQAAVAAKTAQIAFQLLGRTNTGLIQPLRELPARIQEVGSNFRSATTSASGFRGALSGVSGALGGPWGLALAAATVGLGAWIAKKNEATAASREFRDALEADGGVLADNTREQLANNLAEEGAVELARELGLDLGLVTDALLGNAQARRQVNGTLDEYSDKLVDAAAGGTAVEEQTALQAHQADRLRGILEGQNGVITEGVGLYNDTQAAMLALGVETGVATEHQIGLNGAMAEGAFQARDLKTALDELTGGAVTVAGAEADFQEAVDRATESVATNGATLDDNTEAGRANRDALEEIRNRTNDLTVARADDEQAVYEQIEAQREGRAEFVRVARQMGLTEGAAEDLADEYLGIPSEVETEIRIAASGTWAPASTTEGQARQGTGPWSGFATGGPVSGPGTATSDSIPALLSDGEFVEPTASVDYYGAGLFEALRHRAIPREALPGFATGGRVTRGQGTQPWDVIHDHQDDVREEYNRLVASLIGRVGDDMAEQWASAVAGPMGVVGLAEASIGRFPEIPSGSNQNAITSWYGMNGAPWCAMFISWLFSQVGASSALGGASRTAWTGDYYGSGMSTTNNPMPGDVAVYGTRHVNLVTSPGGSRRVGGNQSNNVTAGGGYSGGTIFRPNWGLAGFATGGRVSIADIMAQDREEDQRSGMDPQVRNLRQIMGLAGGGLASGWTVVGEEGPELARFDDPARIYSNQESARMLSVAGQAAAQGGDGASAPLVGEYHQHLHDSQATMREAMGALTHTLRAVDYGGLYG